MLQIEINTLYQSSHLFIWLTSNIPKSLIKRFPCSPNHVLQDPRCWGAVTNSFYLWGRPISVWDLHWKSPTLLQSPWGWIIYSPWSELALGLKKSRILLSEGWGVPHSQKCFGFLVSFLLTNAQAKSQVHLAAGGEGADPLVCDQLSSPKETAQTGAPPIPTSPHHGSPSKVSATVTLETLFYGRVPLSFP